MSDRHPKYNHHARVQQSQEEVSMAMEPPEKADFEYELEAALEDINRTIAKDLDEALLQMKGAADACGMRSEWKALYDHLTQFRKKAKDFVAAAFKKME